MKELLLIALGGMVANNIAFTKLLGISPIIGGKTNGKKAIVTGAFIALVMLLAALICWPIENWLLAGKLEFLRIFMYVIVVLGIVSILECAVKAAFKESLGLYFPVIALNSAVLGLALNNATDKLGFAPAMFAALGAGLGYMLAMWVFAGVQGRIQQKYVPEAFKGLPVSVLAAGIVAMAFLAFS